jgi:hypothetical protein
LTLLGLQAKAVTRATPSWGGSSDIRWRSCILQRTMSVL